jgi:flavoprotein
MMGSGKDLNNKYKQLLELKNNATKSRLSRKNVHYKKSEKVLKMTPKDRALQKQRMEEHREFIKRRERVTLFASLITLAIIIALLAIFVF